MARVPYVTDDGKVYDPFSRLLMDRIIFINGDFNNDMADSVVAQLLFLEKEDSEKDIYMYINSPGGVITAMLAIYDTMNYIAPDVCTVCYGQAASAAAFILSSGTKGKRYSLPNSRIMIHQPSGGAYGQVTDIEIQYNEITRLKKMLNIKLAENTGQSLEKINVDVERDYFMSAQEAVEYGLIDKIEDSRK